MLAEHKLQPVLLETKGRPSPALHLPPAASSFFAACSMPVLEPARAQCKRKERVPFACPPELQHGGCYPRCLTPFLELLCVQDACVTKHSLGYVEQIASAMAPRGCLHALASAGSGQVFAAAFVLAANVAKTDSLELQVCGW